MKKLIIYFMLFFFSIDVYSVVLQRLVTQPNCVLNTGSVILLGLPAGAWKINPGGINGAGSSHKISGLLPGVYNFTVTDALGFVGTANNVVINPQPITPSAPGTAAIIQPTCATATGSLTLTGLPAGAWTIKPGSISGMGMTCVIAGLTSGTYAYTVTNSNGCSSAFSVSVTINPQPVVPAVPVGLNVSSITQNTAIVNWSATPFTTYSIRYRVLGAFIWSNSATETNNFNLINLTANTTYQCQVRAINSCGASSYTASAQFTTLGLKGILVQEPGNDNETYMKKEIRELLVYPNPASDVVNFAINTPDEEIQYITIMDMLGKTIIQKNTNSMNNKNQIEIDSNVPSGLYIINIRTDSGQQYMQKISLVN